MTNYILLIWRMDENMQCMVYSGVIMMLQSVAHQIDKHSRNMEPINQLVVYKSVVAGEIEVMFKIVL